MLIKNEELKDMLQRFFGYEDFYVSIDDLIKQYNNLGKEYKVYPADTSLIPKIEFEIKKLDIRDSNIPQTTKYNPVKVSELIKREVKEFPWLIHGLIPEGGITVFSGSTGCGKSLIVLYIANCIGRGINLFETFPTKKSKILLIDLEMTEYDCIERAKTICSESDDIFIQFEKSWRVEDEHCVDWLKNFVTENKINLIIFDTLSKTHLKNENSNSEMTFVMQKFIELCNQLKITILLIHHHNKNTEAIGLGKGRGASAIPDNCASYFTVESKKMITINGRSVLELTLKQEKSRRREGVGTLGINVGFDENKKQTTFDFLGMLNEEQEKVETAKNAVLEYIQINPNCNKTSIHDVLDKKYTRRAIDGAITILTEGGDIKQTKYGNSKLFSLIELGQTNNALF